MLQLLAGKDASKSDGAVRFKRHRPEQTLLYRLVEQYYPDFVLQWAAAGIVHWLSPSVKTAVMLDRA